MQSRYSKKFSFRNLGKIKGNRKVLSNIILGKDCERRKLRVLFRRFSGRSTVEK